jgi:hypothetical protein
VESGAQKGVAAREFPEIRPPEYWGNMVLGWN